jgi:hypothetical protein
MEKPKDLKRKVNFKDYKTWLFLAVLIATFLLVYSPHFSYPYPLHADEWRNIEGAKKLFSYESGKELLTSSNFEWGYHFFLNFLGKLGFNLVLIYKFLPAIFACVAAVILFAFMLRITKNYIIAIGSMVFFASLPSNVNLLGLWFGVAMTFSISFIFLFFFLFIEGINQEDKRKSKAYILPAMIILSIILFIYPQSAAFIIPTLLVYMILNYKEIRKKPINLIVLLPIILYFGNILRAMGSKKLILNTIKIGESYLEPGITQNPVILTLGSKLIYLSPYFLPLLYGFIPFFLAMIGLYFAIKDKKLQIFAIWFLTTILFLFCNNFTEISFVLRERRAVYFCLLSLVPLSAIGLYNLLLFVKNKINRHTQEENMKKKRIFTVFSIIILLVLAGTFYNYGKQREGTEVYHLIEEEDYSALTFLDNYDSNMIVLAPLSQSTAIYSITDNTPVETIFYISKENDSKAKKVEEFFQGDCEKKEEIITFYKVDYIISKYPLNCGWENIYAEKNYIYKINK